MFGAFSTTAFVGITAIFILIVIEEVVEVDVAISMSIYCQIVIPEEASDLTRWCNNKSDERKKLSKSKVHIIDICRVILPHFINRAQYHARHAEETLELNL
jgi:hypothetical protein